MKEVPRQVREAFKLLRQAQKHLYLKPIRQSFYVYKQTYEYQPEKKRSKTISEYVGRIESDGTFIKRMTSYKGELEKAEALIASRGGKIIWHRKGGKEEPAQGLGEIALKETDLRLLMALSMNSRMPVPMLAELAGLNEQTAYSRLKSLEEKLGIKYLLELDVEKLGYLRYLILIKFEDKKPTREEIEDAVKDNHNIQFVAMAKGDYDVIVYVVDETPLKAYDNLLRLRQKESISKYEASWIFTDFAQTYSFMPLRDQFIESVVKKKLWQRSKETPRPERDQLIQREFLLLKELNSNANMSFASVDQRYGLNKGTSRYAYQALKESGLIVRPTISLTNMQTTYVGAILLYVTNYRIYDGNRYKFLMELMEYGKIANKYCLSGNIGAPLQGALSFLPVNEDGYLDRVTADLEKELPGSFTRSLVITDVIVGSLCYRRFDNMHSRQHRLLVEFKKMEPAKLAPYA
ncbi:MAG: Lrp/AsnC family transcriptional regulator [Candidatus Micrarchaeota archaeon]|nr:Lrp/AsnC family transcriptional regulator [Candidatus Micrarchaeota archaeon]